VWVKIPVTMWIKVPLKEGTIIRHLNTEQITKLVGNIAVSEFITEPDQENILVIMCGSDSNLNPDEIVEGLDK